MLKKPNKSMRNNGLRLVLSACASAGAIAAALPAYAQSSFGAGSDTIVVTATKREENIQDVPASITAVSGAEMDKLGVTDIQGIARRTPGLQFGNFTDLKLATTAIRGINAIDATSAGKDPAVAYYLDEVFLGIGVGASVDFFDIERVEVLRGPQGTLFGRNAIGGVINITTRKPSDEFEASLQVEGGNYDYILARGSVNIPVQPGLLAVKLSGSYLEREGVTDNLFLDRKTNDALRRSLRLSALLTPTENAEFLFTADYQTVDQHSKQYELLSVDTNSTFYARATGQIPDLPAVPVNMDPFDRNVYSDVISREELESYGFSLKGEIDLGAVSLVSVSSYRAHDYFNVSDTDMSPLSILTDGDPEDTWRVSQELRLVSNNDGPFNWIAGAYFYRQHSDNLSYVTVGDDLSILLAGDTSFGGLETGSTATLNAKSYAAFASATYDFTDRLSMTVGGRYTYEEKDIDFVQVDLIDLLGGNADVEAADDWSAFTPSVSLSADVTDNVMTYVTVSRGFKSGGYNDAIGEATGISFDPEYLWNYEGGVKATLADGRLIANGSVFHMVWSDIQIQQDDPNTPVYDPRTSNAGKAHSTGFEAELSYRATDALTLGVNGTLIDAEYDEGNLPTEPGSPVIPLRKLDRVPKYSVNFSADLEQPIGAGLVLLATGEVMSQGKMYLSLDNQPEGVVDPYTLFNAQIGVGAEDGSWSLLFWGRNLTDKTYKERLFDVSNIDLLGQKLIDLGQPRTLGVRLISRF